MARRFAVPTVLLLALAAFAAWFAARGGERGATTAAPGVDESPAAEAATPAIVAPAQERQRAIGAVEPEAPATPTLPTGTARDADGPLRLAGRVLDLDDQPVPNADVRVWNTRERIGLPDQTTVSDGNGGFEFAGVGSSFYAEAAAPGLAAVEVLSGATSVTEATELVLRLAPVEFVRGTVFDATRAPVQGVRVELSLPRPPSLARSDGTLRVSPRPVAAKSDQGGGLFFLSVARQRRFVVAHHAGRAAWSGWSEPGERLEIVLGSGASFVGRVFTWDDRPARGATVQFRRDKLVATSICDDIGWFQFDGLDGKPAWLAIRAPGNAVRVVEPVSPDEGAPPLDVWLDPARAIGGVVLDRDGEPAADAAVSIEGGRTVKSEHGAPLHVAPTWEHFTLDTVAVRTDPKGAFRFDDLYEGDFQIAVTLPESTRRQFWVFPSGSESLVLHLGAEANDVVLEGVVRNALDGRPVDEFVVTVLGIRASGSPLNSLRQEFRSPDGLYEVAGLAPGKLGVMVEAPGYSSLGVKPLERAPGRHRIDVELQPTRTLRLRFLNAEGEPEVDLTVWVLDENGRMRWLPMGRGRTSTLSTDENGEVILHDLPAGPTSVRFQRIGEPTVGEREVDLTLPLDDVGIVRL